MPKWTKTNLTWQRFGRLLALSFLPDDSKYASYLWRCDCGVEKQILAQSVTGGFTLSCGCYQKEGLNIRTIHGHSGAGRTGTYNSWAGMMDRCEWGNHPEAYAAYGAVGIRVDPKWHKFEAFLADMGERPSGTSIDRIDNDKGYAPGNCRWADRRTQALNRSNTVRVMYGGELVAVLDLCEKLGLSRFAVRARAVRRNGDYVAALRSMGIEVSAAAARGVEIDQREHA